MTRKGEIGRARLARWWPHHVALPAEAVRGSANSEDRQRLCRQPVGGARTYHLRRDDKDLVVFCFAKREDAQAFAERFGGEVVPERKEPPGVSDAHWQPRRCSTGRNGPPIGEMRS